MAIQALSDGDVNLAAAQVRYSTGAIVLHWLLALTLAFQIAFGFAMPHHGAASYTPMQLHKSIGITILLLTLLRMGWRLTHRPPPAVESGWEGVLAKAVHFAFYVVLLLGPLTGWIIVSTARLKVPTVLFGIVPWPHLPLPDSLSEPMEGIHEILGWIAVVLFLLHVAGALRHQFLLRDPVIKRMAPGGSVAAAMVLLAAAVALYFGTGTYVSTKYPRPAWRGGPPKGVAPATPTVVAPPLTTVAEVPAAEASAAATPSPTPTVSPTAALGPPPVWTITGGKRLAFSVDNGGSAIGGTFKDWSGAIKFDPDHPETANLAITVKLASAAIGDATQDGMLQGAEFFASGANPTATWRSTSVTQTGPGRYRASGTLSLKGASRPQTVTFALSGKDMKRHVSGNATISRGAFGVGTGEAAEGLAKSVALSFAFDATGK